jgi:hypothetical protein
MSIYGDFVSWQSLAKVILRVQFMRCTFPELWGLYAVWSFHFIFKILARPYTISATKAWPLSDLIERGSPFLGTTSLKRAFITFHAFSVCGGGKPESTLSNCRQEQRGILVSSKGLDLCEVHFPVFKRHGAYYLYPRACLRPLTYIVSCTYNVSSTHLGAQGGKLGNEIASV